MKKTKSLASLKKSAWDLLSKIIRLSHADEGGTCSCYTCGRLMFWKEAQAGHAIPGRTGAVLLREEVIRPQCCACNIFGRGMYHIFTTKLIEENGMDWWQCQLVESKQIMKWDRVKLEEKIVSLKQRLKELE